MPRLQPRAARPRVPVRFTAILSLCVLAVVPAVLAEAPLPLGVYLGNGLTGVGRVPAFAKWLGRDPDRILDFLAYDSWKSFESDARWTCESWAAGKRPVVAAITLSVPLTVQGTPLSDVASGAHDQTYLAVARYMVQNGWGRAVVRLGWEFNGAWMPWAAGSDPKAYVAAYRRVVTLMRSIPGEEFSFDWCCACGKNAVAPDSVYPGDDVVDIMGMDVYTRYYNAFDAIPALRWRALLDMPFGLEWLVRFSTEHHKRLSVPEWGTGEALSADGGTGGGDDPFFVTSMAEFLRDNNAVYSDYWDFHAPDYNASVSDGEHPKSGEALRSLFGPPSTGANPQKPLARFPR
jgi:Glycosyl hydrolase family 26